MTGATWSPAATVAGGATGVTGTASCIFWYSQKLTVCATPSSVTTKSFAVSPSIGLPLLSVTETVSTTSCVFTVIFTGVCAARPRARSIVAQTLSLPRPDSSGRLLGVYQGASR